MDYMVKQSGSLSSAAEDVFTELFCDTFGPDKSQFLFIQYSFTDIYGNRRFINFALENESVRIEDIFTNPFKRFEDMQFMKRCRKAEYVEFKKYVVKKVTEKEIEWILGHCEEKLREYCKR